MEKIVVGIDISKDDIHACLKESVGDAIPMLPVKCKYTRDLIPSSY
ncbi:hypothetical protein EZS27_044124 [termite gut metagenome]|uniref:Uncharacterized protein n=1 Tax=termite gut metagenome TaxID=433724 RepID=A0A5J4P6A7_9ZZZZ